MSPLTHCAPRIKVNTILLKCNNGGFAVLLKAEGMTTCTSTFPRVSLCCPLLAGAAALGLRDQTARFVPSHISIKL